MRKKAICCIIAVISLMAVCINTASAAIIEYDMSYWNSDVDNIGKWINKSIPVYVGTNSNYSSLSATNLKSYLSTALSSWSCAGLSVSYVSQQSSAKLSYGGITRAQATSQGISSEVVGVTFLNATTQLAKLYYGAAQKRLYRIDSASIYLIESLETGTTTAARKVAVHEFGHAFGYFGHYSSGAVMTARYANMTSTTPNTAEKNHLKQVY